MFLQTGRYRLRPHCFNVHIIPQPPVQPLSGCDELRQIAPLMAFYGEIPMKIGCFTIETHEIPMKYPCFWNVPSKIDVLRSNNWDN